MPPVSKSYIGNDNSLIMRVNYQRNIPVLYLYSIFIKRVSLPVTVLYFLLNNLSFTEIGILAAVMSIVHVSTEIHGGIFADIHGKKTSLILHSVFGTLTMFFYFVGDSFFWFLLASVMYGISGSFISGTRNALLYDTLRKLGRTSEFKKFNGKVLLYSHAVNALVLLPIPVMYIINPKLPFLIGIGFFLVSLMLAFFFTEPPLTRKSETGLAMYNVRFMEALKEIRLSKKLFSAILLAMLTASFVFMGSEFVQPLLRISGLQIVYFGVVYALMRGFMGFGGSVTHRLEKHFTTERLLLIGIAGMMVSFTGFSFGAGAVIVLAVLLLKLSEGFNRIILEDEINRNIRSENRTTILSMSSLSQALSSAGLVFVFGIMADLAGVQDMFVYALGLFMIAAVLAMIFVRKK